MAVSYSASLKSARMVAVITKLDAGSSFAFMEICSSSYAAILATLVLPKPSFAESGGVLTMLGVPVADLAADNTGTAAIARVKDSDGNVIVSGLTVGTSATDIVLNAVSLTAGQNVSLSSGTITHSA